MVDALTKRPSEYFSNREARMSEYYRRFITASLKNRRIPVIKFCDRLHNIHTIDSLELSRAFRILNETTAVLNPILNYLGFKPLAAVLETICSQKAAELIHIPVTVNR